MDRLKQAELLSALTTLSTEAGMKSSAQNILKGLERFECTMDSYSMSDIELLEAQSGPTRRRKFKG